MYLNMYCSGRLCLRGNKQDSDQVGTVGVSNDRKERLLQMYVPTPWRERDEIKESETSPWQLFLPVDVFLDCWDSFFLVPLTFSKLPPAKLALLLLH